MTTKDLIEVSVFGILLWLVAVGGGWAIWQAIR